jgi:hypothetical protein
MNRIKFFCLIKMYKNSYMAATNAFWSGALPNEDFVVKYLVDAK